MKTLLLAIALIFSVSLAEAQEGNGKKKAHSNVPKAKITYSEGKYKKTFAKKQKRTKAMFAGEGNSHHSRMR